MTLGLEPEPELELEPDAVVVTIGFEHWKLVAAAELEAVAAVGEQDKHRIVPALVDTVAAELEAVAASAAVAQDMHQTEPVPALVELAVQREGAAEGLYIYASLALLLEYDSST